MLLELVNAGSTGGTHIMDQLPKTQPIARRRASSGGPRVLAQALQMFEERPPRNRMEFAVSRTLADEMRRIVCQPGSVEQVFRLAAEFPAIEALLDDFLMSARIIRDGAGNYAVLDELLKRLTKA